MSGETHLDFTANGNGHPSSAPGNLGFNQIELHRIDKRQATVKEEKGGAVVATIHEKLSKDGHELTSTTTTTGQPDQITVWGTRHQSCAFGVNDGCPGWHFAANRWMCIPWNVQVYRRR